MPIETANPVVVPAQDEKTYDTWRCAYLVLDHRDPTALASAKGTMRKCYYNAEGQPVDAPPIVNGLRTEQIVSTADYYGDAANDPALYSAGISLVAWMAGKAESQEADELSAQQNDENEGEGETE